MGRSKGSGTPSIKCKLCKKAFDQDPNPLVKNPGPNDLDRRRCAGSKDCKACPCFVKNHPTYKEMTPAALEEWLQKPENQQEYDRDFDDYAEQRRNGKRKICLEGQFFWAAACTLLHIIIYNIDYFDMICI